MVSPVFTSGVRVGEWLIVEASGTRSRENRTVTTTANNPLPSGTVLGVVTATGKFVKHDTAATNGAQNAAAILYTPLAGVAQDNYCVVFVRDCEVLDAVLNNRAGTTVAQRASLAQNGIIVRPVMAV